MKIFVIRGPNRGQSFDFTRDDLSLGRATGNHVRINDPSLSRHHLKLFRQGDRFFVEDLKSMNGTITQGRLLNPGERVEVIAGQPIFIGDSIICLDKKPPTIQDLPQNEKMLTRELDIKQLASLHQNRPMTYAKNMQLIYSASMLMMQNLELNELFERIMDYLLDIFKRIDRTAVLLFDGQTGEISQVTARSRYGKGEASLNYSRTIVNRVLETGRAVTMPDLDKEISNDLSKSMELIRSVMCVPLISKSQVRGVLYADSLKEAYGFRDDDLLLFYALSSPAAIAIENAFIHANMEKIIEERTQNLRAARNRLSESESRFRAVFNNMTSGAIVLQGADKGKRFLVVDFNAPAAKAQGAAKHNSIHGEVQDIFPDFREQALMAALQSVGKGGKPERVTVRAFHEEDIVNWKDYYICRLKGEEILAIYDDITEEKRAEKREKLLQAQLLVSQKMESIGAFAGGTAHNFRNILQAISGNVEYLEMVHGRNPDIKELSELSLIHI